MTIPQPPSELDRELRHILSQNKAYYMTAKKVGQDAERHTQIGVDVERTNFDDYISDDQAVEAIKRAVERHIVGEDNAHGHLTRVYCDGCKERDAVNARVRDQRESLWGTK